jgi:polysaccharide biosynthesis/export protein
MEYNVKDASGSAVSRRNCKGFLDSDMRTAIPLVVPILLYVFCGLAHAQERQSKPPAAGSEMTDPTRIAGERPDPAKASLSGPPVDSNYVIGPEDVIVVWAYQPASINNQYTVGSDGMIHIPLIGQVKAGGMTRGEVEAQIANLLKTGEIVIEPNITVNVAQVHSKKVYISGDGIAHPGVLDLVVPMHVSEVIVWAGGFRDFANKRHIRVIRIGPDGNPTTLKYNDNDVSHGKKLDQNVLVRPGDHIYVD